MVLMDQDTHELVLKKRIPKTKKVMDEDSYKSDTRGWRNYDPSTHEQRFP